MLFEEAQHTVDAIAKRVGVLAGRQKVIAPTKIDTHVAPAANRMPRLALVVPEDGQRLQRDAVIVAQSVLVIHREIPIDATADLLALGTYGDRLGHLEHAILEDADIAMKTEYAFVGGCQYRQTQQEQRGESFHSTAPNLASGTLAASSDDRWKNSR